MSYDTSRDCAWMVRNGSLEKYNCDTDAITTYPVTGQTASTLGGLLGQAHCAATQEVLFINAPDAYTSTAGTKLLGISTAPGTEGQARIIATLPPFGEGARLAGLIPMVIVPSRNLCVIFTPEQIDYTNATGLYLNQGHANYPYVYGGIFLVNYSTGSYELVNYPSGTSIMDVHREYEAICRGVMTAGGTVDAPIDRHPTDRVRMAIRDGGRDAVRHYRVIRRFRAHTHVRLQLETGRTHQIRVHLAHAGFPIVCDKVYGGRLTLPKRASETLRQALREFPRQALHAARLQFDHPVTGKPVECASPLPADMRGLSNLLAAEDRAA